MPVDQALGAEDDREVELVCVLGCGFGCVYGDVQVVAGDGENVAVKGDAADVGVVDDLAAGLVARIRKFCAFPEFDEPGARGA